MASTIFDRGTVISKEWLNQVNNSIFNGLGAASTPSDIRTSLSVYSIAQTNSALATEGQYKVNYTLGNVTGSTTTLTSNTTGSDCIGLGVDSLFSNTIGSGNIGIGTGAVFSNTTGIDNIGIGSYALSNGIGGNENTAVGTGAGQSITGDNNTAIGAYSLYNHTTGINNTVIGAYSGSFFTTGSHNTIIGANCILPPTLNNNIVLSDGLGSIKAQHNSTNWELTDNVYVSGVVRTLATTVANLPSAASVGMGARAFVTNANSTTFLSIVAGGGTNKVPVVSDGTNWLIG